MAITGGCYCKALRYESAAPMFKGLCFCRECQQVSGGAGNLFMVVAGDSFKYTQGAPKGFTRTDIENPVTREFCAECGTGILTRTPRNPDNLILKAGTLDDPGVYDAVELVLFTSEKQPHHIVPEGARAFEKFPG